MKKNTLYTILAAVAKELKADVQVKLLPTKTTFDAYPNYTFDDTGKAFYYTEQEIFKGNLDQQGKAFFSTKAGLEANPPGKVKANFNIRIFEKGGGFSVDRTTFDYAPYRGYVGLQLPEGQGYHGALLSNKNNLIPIVTVDEKGQPVARKGLKIEIFALKWRWWFDRSDEDDLANYIGGSKLPTGSRRGYRAKYDCVQKRQSNKPVNHWPL